ncbi:SseB family protein [Actinoplanes sp. NBC_00393]|uniref:SAV_915 family protein n=1 Tax=Actinoplanes sp. NBC_00393 TaxID=2975953 RepID=UPI002E23891C
MVYVPCGPVQAEADELSIDIWPMRDGRRALLVYSALDRLIDCCGQGQPWAVIPTIGLDRLRLESGFDLVFLDLEIPDECRRPGSAG